MMLQKIETGTAVYRFCHFPQELIVKLKQLSNIEKIQIQCHEYMIRKRSLVLLPNIQSNFNYSKESGDLGGKR